MPPIISYNSFPNLSNLNNIQMKNYSITPIHPNIIYLFVSLEVKNKKGWEQYTTFSEIWDAKRKVYRFVHIRPDINNLILTYNKYDTNIPNKQKWSYLRDYFLHTPIKDYLYGISAYTLPNWCFINFLIYDSTDWLN